MTLAIPPADLASSIVSELGGSESKVDMMIGIGLNKESDAVYFQYLGEEQKPSALMMPSGKPCTRMANIRLVGLDVAEDVGEFKSTKLNLFVESSAGRTLMLTSGLNTIWSQCLITSLMGLFNDGTLSDAFTLDTWKGTSKMRPCFAAVRQSGNKISDQMMYDQLRDLRTLRDTDKLLAVMRDAVQILNAAVTGGPVEDAVVSVEEPTVVTDGDF